MKYWNQKTQLSAFIPADLNSPLRQALTSSVGFLRDEPTSRYESLRGRLHGRLVIVYSSGKVVYEQSEETRHVIERILYGKYSQEGVIVGSDEAGKGEVAGPLVIAAVALDPRQASYLQSMGVADSKVVPEGMMGGLANAIRLESIAHKVLTIEPFRFNELFDASKSIGKNLNDILAWGHGRVLQAVIQGLPMKPGKIIVDEFDSSKKKAKTRVIEGLLEGERIQAMPHAGGAPSVAAASILARSSYLTWIKRNLTQSRIQQVESRRYDTISSQPDVRRYFKVSYLAKLAQRKPPKREET